MQTFQLWPVTSCSEMKAMVLQSTPSQAPPAYPKGGNTKPKANAAVNNSKEPLHHGVCDIGPPDRKAALSR